MKIRLDLKDRKILYELEKNAKQTFSQIAKKVRLSKQLVNYKMRKLEKLGIIKGYHTIIDTYKFGYLTFRVYLKLQNTTIQKEKEIINLLINQKEIAVLYKIDGNYDFGFGVWVKNIYEFYTIWEKILKYKGFIEYYNISIYSPIYHYTRTFLVPNNKEEPKTKILGENMKVDIDDLDLKILRILAPNIRIPIVEIADKLKTSPQLINNRIKRLEKKKIIQGYRANLNWQLLDYEYYHCFINLKNMGKKEELMKYCQINPYIIQVNQTIGNFDFEIEIQAEDKKHFKSIMNEIKNKFRDIFKNYTYFQPEKSLKEIFMPLK